MRAPNRHRGGELVAVAALALVACAPAAGEGVTRQALALDGSPETWAWLARAERVEASAGELAIAPGGRLETRPIFVERGADLVLEHALGAPGEATVAVRCDDEPASRLVHLESSPFDTLEAAIPLGGEEHGRLCRFAFALESEHAEARWRLGRIAQRLDADADPDADGQPNHADGCPSFAGDCGPRLRDGLLDAVAGVPHRQRVVEAAVPVIVTARHAPEGLTVTPDGLFSGTPEAGFDGAVALDVYAGPDYRAAGVYRMRVHEAPLTPSLRHALVFQVARPRERPDGSLALATLTRFEAAPVVVVDPALASPELEALLREAVARLSGHRFEARLAEDGAGPVIRVNVAERPRAERITSHDRWIADGERDPFGEGAILAGLVELPPDASPETVLHELGHVFNGPHSWLPGDGFVQQRLRRGAAAHSPVAEDMFGAEERRVYAMVHRFPIGTAADELVEAGLIAPADLRPAPEVREVLGTVRAGDRWVPRADGPIRAGARVVIFGGHLQGPWGCASEDELPWHRPRVWVEGVNAPLVPEMTPFVGDGCQRLEVVLPAGAREGSLVVEVEREDGGVARSAPYPLDLRP